MDELFNGSYVIPQNTWLRSDTYLLCWYVLLCQSFSLNILWFITRKNSIILQRRTSYVLYIIVFFSVHSVQFSRSVVCVQLFATPWAAAIQASLSITNSQSLLKLMSIESVMPPNYLILCRPLLLPPSISPSIRVFSSESASVLPMNIQD